MKRKKNAWKYVSNVHERCRLSHLGAHAFKRICVCVFVQVCYTYLKRLPETTEHKASVCLR